MADYEDMPAPVVERKAIVLPWMILQCILMYVGPRCVLCDELPRWLHAFYCPRCNAVLACNDDHFGLQSQLAVELEADQEVRIVVAGFRGRNGSYRLNITGP